MSVVTGIFDDELAKVNLKLRDAQQTAHAFEQQKDQFASELRVERSSNGKLRTEVEQLTRELQTSRALATEAAAQASRVQVLEIELSDALSGLRDTTAKLEKAEASLAKTAGKLKACEKDLSVSWQTLREREHEFDEAATLLAAFRQARDAEAVIAGKA